MNRWQPNPPQQDLRLRGGRITADAEACVALFLRPRIAMPLLLPGSMRPPSGVPASASGAIRCHLHFCLDSPVQESLDRLIFRHHRRAVARSRNQHYPLDE
ncbi:PilZ domain-containing protein [Acidithiobacillus ferrianus]|uniref:PilZ domain-containing protein n=1 Tax=Acidithiobacillus ferrianus TaxID=2678518 RepID=UPI003B83482C